MPTGSSTARPHRRCGMAQNNRRRGCVVLSCTCRPEPCRARQPNPPRKRQAAHPQPQAKEKLRTGDTEVELTGSNISGWDRQPEITDEVVIGGGTSGITTYEALHEALQTGGGSADAPTLITLGSDITIPAGGSSSSRTYINGKRLLQDRRRRSHPRLGSGQLLLPRKCQYRR